MATYLSGLTDYIPQFQPFTPDLNIYQSVMQQKQSQYDSAYNSINKIYGKYFYAPLSHSENQKTRDEVMKTIDFDLKRISSLDLSLEQNVNVAAQVFKPFYENQYLMKDMAFTKNYMTERGRAENLKLSTDVEQRKQYWDKGLRALDYQVEEFKNSSLESTLGFSNPTYTNYVSVMDKALKLAKEADLNIETVNFSPDGKFIIKTKNGENLKEPLSRLFEANLASDPAIQEVYKTQAYVDRKDYAKTNSAMFGGDENKAELQYLNNAFNMFKDQKLRQYQNIQDENLVYNNKIKTIEKQIAEGNKSQTLKKQLQDLKYNKSINDQILERAKNDMESITTDSEKVSEDGMIPYGDINTLRYKVDNAIASSLLAKDLGEAAQVYAYRNAGQDLEVNQYAVIAEEHKNRMAQIATKAKYDRDLEDYKVNKEYQKQQIANGKAYFDQNGQFQEIVDDFSTKPNTDAATKESNMKTLSTESVKGYSQNVTDNALKPMLDHLESLKSQGLITEQQIRNVLQVKGQGYSVKAFTERLTTHNNQFLRYTLKEEGIKKITSEYKKLLLDNKGLAEYTKSVDYNFRMEQVNGYLNILGEDSKWRKETSTLVEKELVRKNSDINPELIKALYNENGEIVSEAQFNKKFRELLAKDQSKTSNIIISSLYDELDKNEAALKGFNLVNKNTSWFETPGAALKKRELEKNIASTKSLIKKFSGSESVDYKELKKQAGELYSNSNFFDQQKIKLPVGVKQMQSGTGLFADYTFINANANNPASKGYVFANQAASLVNSLDLAFGENSISITGANSGTLSGIKKGDEDYKKNHSDFVAILAQIQSDLKNTKSKMGDIEVGTLPFLSDGKKAAVVFRPSATWLKQYVGTEDKPGLIDQEQYNQALKNGITVISDKSTLSSLPTVSRAKQDFVEVQIKSNPAQGYVLENPYGDGYMQITESDIYPGQYKIKSVYNGQTDIKPITNYNSLQGFEPVVKNMMEAWQQLAQQESYGN